MKLKVTVRMTEEQHRQIAAFAPICYRTMSEFMLACAMVEVKRHAAKTDLYGMIEPIVMAVLKKVLPSTVNEADGDANRDPR